MHIPFFKSDITDAEIKAVTDVLQSGWLTSGSVGQQFSEALNQFCQADYSYLVDSATAGLEMALRFYGIEAGDEVITTPYTYVATVTVIENCGATPVLVDIHQDDFSINEEKLRSRINSKTKAIISVDFSGFPVRYDAIKKVLEEKKYVFQPCNERQEKMGRILFVSDAAHSLGSFYKNKPIGSQADFSIFSFHAVKNLTTGEGGAIVFNSHPQLDGEEALRWFKLATLHGQNKSALEKASQSQWRYDILLRGAYKRNLPDVLAAIGYSQLKRYDAMLKKRLQIMNLYENAFKDHSFCTTPLIQDENRLSNGHFFALRVKDSKLRDIIIAKLLDDFHISANVHFIPIPLFSAYSSIFDIHDYPIALQNYEREISLPVFSTMQIVETEYVIESLKKILAIYI